MFKGVDQIMCFREGIITLQLFTIRKNNTYIVTPFFTKYRNNYVRANADELYNFEWQINAVDTLGSNSDKTSFQSVFNPLSKNKELVFNEN